MLTQQVAEELPICWVGPKYRASKYTNYIIDEMSKSDKNSKKSIYFRVSSVSTSVSDSLKHVEYDGENRFS